MDKPLVLNADNYFDNEFSEDWCKNETMHNKIKHIYDLKHKSEKSNYTFPVDTGTYYAATILPDGSFYSSSVSSPTLTLHQNHRYELKSDYDSLSYSKGRWVQKNRIITLHDECLNYEMFFTIEDDKKLYGTFPKHEENIDGDYFIHSKTVEKMNDW